MAEEPSLERLSRFTPDAGGLDRDALLFAAGRNSARPNRGWMTLAALLAGTQALPLLLLWPQPTRLPGRSAPTVAGAPGPPEVRGPAPSKSWANLGPLPHRLRLREPEAGDRPAGDTDLIGGGPPLRAFPLPPSLLN
jgi:hypothetical protein